MAIEGDFLTLIHMIITWWQQVKGKSLHAWLLSLLPNVILWQIWKFRCKARFENTKTQSDTIISTIKSQIVETYAAFKLTLPKGNVSSEALNFFGMNTKDICRTYQLVRWIPPPLRWTKLNTNGACKVNPGSVAGGVMRDTHSKSVAAFTSLLGPWTSVIAETKAIHMEICFAKSLNIR